MTDERADAQAQILGALERMGRLIREMGQLVAREHASTRATMAIARLLDDAGEVGVGDVAEALRIDMSVASRQVSELVAEGLVERTVSDGDRRARQLRLTQAGRLPRVLVRTVQEQRPDWFHSDRPASTEDDSPQLSALHELLRRGGVLRLAKGVLRASNAAADEREIVRRIRAWFEQGSFELVVAERALAHLAARGPMTDGELAAAVYPWLGHGWRRGDDPITECDVKQQLWRLSTGLKALEMIAVERGTWTAGPSALTVLPGAVLLADLV